MTNCSTPRRVFCVETVYQCCCLLLMLSLSLHHMSSFTLLCCLLIPPVAIAVIMVECVFTVNCCVSCTVSVDSTRNMDGQIFLLLDATFWCPTRLLLDCISSLSYRVWCCCLLANGQLLTTTSRVRLFVAAHLAPAGFLSCRSDGLELAADPVVESEHFSVGLENASVLDISHMSALEVSPFHGIAIYKSTFTYIFKYVPCSATSLLNLLAVKAENSVVLFFVTDSLRIIVTVDTFSPGLS